MACNIKMSNKLTQALTHLMFNVKDHFQLLHAIKHYQFIHSNMVSNENKVSKQTLEN